MRRRLADALSRRLRAEEGWAMVVAIMVTALMVSMGLATAVVIDSQSQGSARERLDESDFNLAQGALISQMSILTARWPGGSGAAFPTQCTAGSVSTQCPDPSMLTASYNSADYASAPTWNVQVRDNNTATPDFYSDSGTSSQPHWDSNGDGKIWVRATATVKQHTQAVVGLIQVDKQTEQLPHSTLIAGSLDISNNGNKPLICTKLPDDLSGKDCTSSSSQAGPVQVRCTTYTSSCLNIRSPINNSVQISPYNVQVGYPTQQSLSPAALNRLKARAQADGTYYNGVCAPSMQGPQAGMVVFVDSAGSCSYGGSYNSFAQPGVFIVNNTTVTLNQQGTFYGVVYAANPPASGVTVSLHASANLIGGINVDGNGTMEAGSNHINLVFYDFAFSKVTSYGAAHLVQNKWRHFVPTGP
jgi:Tfp pilus assembly protein PilX